ncbi:MAG TPA: MATE family efflux transporter [Caldithrix abyssi]|uniref:MATE family efflux transporter n=1 Tax=Caldithrix abyssi TaxID=187145 RepID=A0A7V4U3Z3_CALAY|nr:MATE family efflux transporter [Caldithrix abyssi]
MALNKQIIRLAVPNIISNLSVPLLSTVDTIIVGHLPGIWFIGAVAVGSMIFNFIYWGFGFLRMGTTGLTAQEYGAGRQQESVMILARALLVALTGGVLLMLLQFPIAHLAFWLVEASSIVEHFASRYFYIRIYAAPATLALYALQGWFLGMQNARYPLYLIVLTNLLNIGFNYLFAIGLGMNSDGVALGTVCAQYIGAAAGMVLLRRSYAGHVRLFESKLLFRIEAMRRFLAVNRDIFLRTLVLVFAFSFFTAKSAEFGDLVLAANTILIQLWMIMAYGIDGFAFAAESLVGKFLGRGDLGQLKRVIRTIFYWGMGLSLPFSLIYFFFDQAILAVFTDKTQVIDVALSFMIWTIIAPPINSVSYLWDGIYIGATATAAMRNTAFIATFLFFLPVYYIGRGLWGNHGLWLALTLFMIVRGLSLQILAGKHIYKRE